MRQWPVSEQASGSSGISIPLQFQSGINSQDIILSYFIPFHFVYLFIYLNLLYLIDSTLTSTYVLSVNLYFYIKKLVAYREEEEEEEEEESTPSSMAHRIHTCTKDTDLFNLEDVGFLQALRVRDDNAALGAG